MTRNSRLTASGRKLVSGHFSIKKNDDILLEFPTKSIYTKGLEVNILSICCRHLIGFQTTKHLQATKHQSMGGWYLNSSLHFWSIFVEIRRNHQMYIRNLTWISSCHCINISFSSVRVKASKHPGNSRQIPDVFGSASARSLRYGATTLALQHHFGTQAKGGPSTTSWCSFYIEFAKANGFF